MPFLRWCSHLQGVILDYFGTYFGILRLLFENRSIWSMKFCIDVLAVPFEGHCTIFSISWPSWSVLGRIFGLILGNVYLILQHCSIFSHETLYRCSWYNYDGHCTKNCFYIMFPGVHFRISSSISRELFNIFSWGVLGAFWSISFTGTYNILIQNIMN